MKEFSANEMEAMIWSDELGVAPSIDLHEKMIENALIDLEARIHHSMMRSEQVIKIIHGGGTGKLRNAIHEWLETQELVLYFRDSTKPGEAGNVTYALLASLR